jgi:hypothetical protein
MDQNTRTMFQRGVEALRAGDRVIARSLLLQVTARAPEYQDAWLWLSDVAETRYERREYLERCVAQDPQSRAAHIARKKLTRLEWESLVAEEDSVPAIRAAPLSETKHVHLSIWKIMALVGIGLVLLWPGMFMVFDYLNNQPDEPTIQMATDIIASPADDPQPADATTTPDLTPTNNQAVSAQTTAETPTSPSQPSVVPYPAEQPPAQGQEPAIMSRGLGLEYSQWEALHGEPEQEFENMAVYTDGRYQVSFYENKIESLQEQWSTDESVSLDEARIRSQQLLPTDSDFVATFAAPNSPGTIVDIYQSNWLRGRFSDWADSEPGTFTIIYQASGDAIRVYSVQLGDMR